MRKVSPFAAISCAPPRTRFTWSRNTKQSKTQHILRVQEYKEVRFWTFNLPQHRSASGRVVCPFAGACAEVCYAGQGWYVKGSVQAAYEGNLRTVLEADKNSHQLAAWLVNDLTKLRATHVRPHDSGDFFAPWYVDAWLEAARALPDVTFYGYTKSIPLIPWGKLPRNVALVQSFGGTRDDLVDRRRPHSVIFPSAAARSFNGYEDGNESDLPVIRRVRKIGLVYHGSSRLTPANAEALRPRAHGGGT